MTQLRRIYWGSLGNAMKVTRKGRGRIPMRECLRGKVKVIWENKGRSNRGTTICYWGGRVMIIRMVAERANKGRMLCYQWGKGKLIRLGRERS